MSKSNQHREVTVLFGRDKNSNGMAVIRAVAKRRGNETKCSERTGRAKELKSKVKQSIEKDMKSDVMEMRRTST